MPSSETGRFRAILTRPLLLTLVLLLMLLWMLDGPFRSYAEGLESRECEQRARLLGSLLRGATRAPSKLPLGWVEDQTDRVLLEDPAGNLVFDSHDPRIGSTSTWKGPGIGVPIWVRAVQRLEPPVGPPRLRCEVLWGEGQDAGSLVYVRSLGRLEQSIRRAQLATGAIWFVWALLSSLFATGSYRRIQRELKQLRSCLDGIPEEVRPLPEEGQPIFDLDRPAQEAARRARIQVDRLRLEIEEREAVLRGMLEGVVAIDAGREVVLINPSAEAMLGIEPGTSRGKRVVELVRSGVFQNLIEQILEHGRRGEVEFEVAEGQKRLRVLGDAQRDHEGALRGAVLVMSDVTELRKLERIRRDFVSNVSHELRTPITAIQGYVHTLLETQEDPDSRRRFLGIISNNVRRMNRIIEDLLSLSRVELKGEQIECVEFDVQAMVERTVEDAQPEALARGIRFAIQIDPNVKDLEGNEPLLERALGNLIDNAVKYGKPNGIVHIRVVDEGESVRFAVKDQGPGIAASHLPRLFERFYRIDRGRSRELGGTGLGLAIVKHIALVHGGEALVESRLAEGSTFSIRIPKSRF